MNDKPSVSMTPESDGFAGRYDRMVERSGSWALKAFIAIVALIAVFGLISQFVG